MINKFEKQLEKWNGGVLRGAQAKLARTLQVSTATVALWSTGKRHPSKGYLNRLAKLFSMDAYEVTRLFLQAPFYPEPYLPGQRPVLRENASAPIAYSANKLSARFADRNSVNIPYLAQIPQGFPFFQETQVSQWWTLPRAEAKGAKFLVRCGATDAPARYANDLLLVAPGNHWEEDCVMLAQQDSKYILRRITRRAGTWYAAPLGKSAAPLSARLKPLGRVVRKITDSI